MLRNYAYPIVGRVGLGNALFPWVRAACQAELHGATLLHPEWRIARLGPYLRGELDKREYWRLFRSPSLLETMRRVNPMQTLARVTEHDVDWQASGQLILFRGMGRFFAELPDSPEFARRVILSQARRKAFATPPKPQPYIGFHVRLGDFAPSTGKTLTQNNTSAPLDFYVVVAESLSAAFPEVPIKVFSDGSDLQLAPLLRNPHVTRSAAASPLKDLFSMADAAGLVGSRSTFSSWGAYLGSVPLLLPPGGNVYGPAKLASEYLGRLPSSWSRTVDAHLGHS